MSIIVNVKTLAQSNLEKWCEDSAVVDDNGAPRILYHGTCRAPDTGIAIFDTEGDRELGTHFGTLAQAHEFVWDEEGYIAPVYLKIQRPLRLEDLGGFTIEFVAPQLDKLKLPEPTDKSLMEGEYLRARLRDAGYDGVVYLNRREGAHDPLGAGGVASADELINFTDSEFLARFPAAEDAWIALSPTQIKSAIGNCGAFNANDPDITDRKSMILASAMDAAEFVEASEMLSKNRRAAPPR